MTKPREKSGLSLKVAHSESSPFPHRAAKAAAAIRNAVLILPEGLPAELGSELSTDVSRYLTRFQVSLKTPSLSI
jgi:hypothetical protein